MRFKYGKRLNCKYLKDKEKEVWYIKFLFYFIVKYTWERLRFGVNNVGIIKVLEERILICYIENGMKILNGILEIFFRINTKFFIVFYVILWWSFYV